MLPQAQHQRDAQTVTKKSTKVSGLFESIIPDKKSILDF